MSATDLRFNHLAFGAGMSGTFGINVHNHDNTTQGWVEQGGQAMHYACQMWEYRTWWHDVSVCRNQAAILVSCKIDQRRSSWRKDDHVVIIAAFNRSSRIVVAQAAVQSIVHRKDEHTDSIVARVEAGGYPNAASDRVLLDEFEHSLRIILQKIDHSDGGLMTMAEVAKANLSAMTNGISPV